MQTASSCIGVSSSSRSCVAERGGDQDEGDIYAVLWAWFLERYLSGFRFRSIRTVAGRVQHNLSWLGRTVAIAISAAADAVNVKPQFRTPSAVGVKITE